MLHFIRNKKLVQRYKKIRKNKNVSNDFFKKNSLFMLFMLCAVGGKELANSVVVCDCAACSMPRATLAGVLDWGLRRGYKALNSFRVCLWVSADIPGHT
ncbi:MAG: hypothetical protein J1E77_07760, partial [Prevotella sp.]|nr:hypothetical protein [Prevotella sp.]